MRPEHLLQALQWNGPYQVHQRPTVLRPDLRAHQLMIGFEALEEPAAHLMRLIPPTTPAWVARPGGDLQPCELGQARGPGDLALHATETESPGGLYGLVRVVDRLLGPGGCPWDRAQTHRSLIRHLIEEAYELEEAVERGDLDQMREELGDVLLQPIMHAQMQALKGGWDIDVVAQTIVDKLVRRHPHVFGDAQADDPEHVLRNWDAIKRAENAQDPGKPGSVLDGVPRSTPALLRAWEISKRAARNGFEWPDLESVWDKFREEEAELREAMLSGDPDRIRDETGDLLFTLVNLARWMDIEPEEALRRMLDRFTHRFQAMEQLAEEQFADRPLRELSPQEWDALWHRAKSTCG